MKVLVFGATGRVGKAFVERALASNHDVCVVVRDPARAPSNVEVIVGDVMDPAIAVKGDRAVVGTLGGIEALATGYANVIRASIEAGTKRFVALVGAGVLQADATRRRNQLPDYPPRFHAIGTAHQSVYDALAPTSLDWTLVCVPNILEGAASGSVRSTADYLPEGKGSITTHDIAAFMVAELETPRFSRRRVGLNT